MSHMGNGESIMHECPDCGETRYCGILSGCDEGYKAQCPECAAREDGGGGTPERDYLKNLPHESERGEACMSIGGKLYTASQIETIIKQHNELIKEIERSMTEDTLRKELQAFLIEHQLETPEDAEATTEAFIARLGTQQPPPVKYYVGKITTGLGEREIDTAVRFKTGGEPWEAIDALASEFWGETPEVDDGTYFWNGAEVSAWADGYQEVTPATYIDLEGIITEL
jgi:hypothetical protein